MTRFSPAERRLSDSLVPFLSAAARLNRELNDACEAHGITHDQYNLLRILRGVYPDGHPRGEIAKRLISRAPDVTRMLDRLESRKLVKRGWDPENRRLSIATLTDAGLALLADVDLGVVAVQRRFTADLSAEDLRDLRRICIQLNS